MAANARRRCQTPPSINRVNEFGGHPAENTRPSSRESSKDRSG